MQSKTIITLVSGNPPRYTYKTDGIVHIIYDNGIPCGDMYTEAHARGFVDAMNKQDRAARNPKKKSFVQIIFGSDTLN